MKPVATLAADLAAGRTSSRELVEQALARIADPAGEGTRAFLKVYADTARAEADLADRLRKSGIVRSPVDGLPVSVKDLFDVGGDVTRAGSKVLAGAPPAKADVPGGRAAARGGRDPRRPHQHGRVRVRRARAQPALRHAAQSLGPEDRAACPAARRPARAWPRPTA